jgi:hypothetical protein
MKTQWLWERFAAKLFEQTQPLGNTFYVFMDERSYSEGNGGDHFARFFRRRGAFWIDGQLRRDRVDGVVDGHGPNRDINRIAASSWEADPPRPFLEFELPPYQGDEVRHNLYACLLGGGHYFFHNDQNEETPTTGIMCYDPHVRGGRKEAVHERLRWLGVACRFLNDEVHELRGMRPHNEAIRQGEGYCLARPSVEYVVYAKQGGPMVLRLKGRAGDFQVSVTDPRTGQQRQVAAESSDDELRVPLSEGADWLIHVTQG